MRGNRSYQSSAEDDIEDSLLAHFCKIKKASSSRAGDPVKFGGKEPEASSGRAADELMRTVL